MVLKLVDVSRYQVERADPLDLAAARAAGYRIANIALTGGRGYVAGAWTRTYVVRARQSNMGVSTYHWLDGRTTGTEQAAATLTRLRSLFGTLGPGFAHFVDVEETGANGITPPTWAHVRDYVTAMQQALGRPIGIYSGDWYWPAGWNGAGLTDMLMAAPNDPVPGPPGDDDPTWYAGWGGWTDRSIMQWGIRPLPGTGNCSLSVIRDHAVWLTLTGGDIVAPDDAAAWILVPCLVSLREEFNQLAPQRDHTSDGSIGDLAHQQEVSDHNPDETGNTPTKDADNLNEVHAIDVDNNLNRADWTMDKALAIIIDRHRSGADDRLQNIIYNRTIWSRSWGWTARAYTGASPHTEHAHFSARYTTAQESDTSPWGLLEADDMSFTDAQMQAFPWQYKGGGVATPGQSTLGMLTEVTLAVRAQKLRDEALLAAVRDDQSVAAILARIDSRAAELATEISQVDEEVWAKVPDPGVPAEEKAALLRAILGQDAAAVGRILAGS